MYHTFVALTKNQAEWETELKNSIENYQFPCVGGWNGLHVYVCSKLKSCFSFKKKYTVSNLALIGYNKRILYAAVGALGSTRDARILKNIQLYQQILEGDAIPKLNICLEGAGTVPMVTIGILRFLDIHGYQSLTKSILGTHSRDISIKSFALLMWLLKTPTGC